MRRRISIRFMRIKYQEEERIIRFVREAWLVYSWFGLKQLLIPLPVEAGRWRCNYNGRDFNFEYFMKLKKYQKCQKV